MSTDVEATSSWRRRLTRSRLLADSAGDIAPAPTLKEAIDPFQSGDLDRARAIAEREVTSAPSPLSQHLLGLIHCRLGNPAQGVEHLRAAADAEPGNVAFNVMLARALVDAGRAAEVVAMPEPPPITSPAELALWHARAEAAVSPEMLQRPPMPGQEQPLPLRELFGLASSTAQIARSISVAEKPVRLTRCNAVPVQKLDFHILIHAQPKQTDLDEEEDGD